MNNGIAILRSYIGIALVSWERKGYIVKVSPLNDKKHKNIQTNTCLRPPRENKQYTIDPTQLHKHLQPDKIYDKTAVLEYVLHTTPHPQQEQHRYIE